ncbi:MAG: glycerol-3-phosphate 1-O-acyltransferase PlsY [Candidatus Eisenbacteria bacterium]|nr:glycerol-3-phosphate 1-O-acyltransferase PlsY [Candidatus Eisenbacteria bacterium]
MSASPLDWIVAAIGAFLLGSLPSGLWWGRILRGIDIRQHGSRNLGATNIYRTLGPAHGIAVLLLDVAKGAGAVLWSQAWSHSEAGAALGGILAVLGHAFTPFARFRGGKGVAAGLGVWLVLAPPASLLALAAFGVVLGLTRRVSAGSLVAGLALVPLVITLGGGEGTTLRGALAAATALLVWVRHYRNIGRLLAGTEPTLWGKGRR